MSESMGTSMGSLEGEGLGVQIDAGYRFPDTVAELVAELVSGELPEDFRTMSSGASYDTDDGDWPPPA